jgi:hypothetical protein
MYRILASYSMRFHDMVLVQGCESWVCISVPCAKQRRNDDMVFFSTFCAFHANKSFTAINLIDRVVDEHEDEHRMRSYKRS